MSRIAVNRGVSTNRTAIGLPAISDVAGSAISFGGNDVISLTPNDTCKLNYFRLETTIKFASTFTGGAAKQFICKWDEPIQLFFETNGTLHLAVKFANYWHEVATTKASWAANTLFRISCSVTADNHLRIYVNGVLEVDTDSGETGGALMTGSGATWFWGASDANGSEGLTAILDEVVFSNFPSKSGGVPNAKITDVIYPLLWHFDEGSGTTVLNSGLGGVLTGSFGAGAQAPSWVDGLFPANSYLTGFVQRRNTKFIQNGEEVKFVGVNNYPLIQDDHTDAELDSFFQCCVNDGIIVVRTWCFNKSVPATNAVGNFRYLSGGSLHWNENTFVSLDRVLAKARQYGIKIVLPLVDQWNSNKGDYCAWNNAISATEYDTVTGDDFHVDEDIKQMFKDFIDKLTARVNTINGISYANDETIFAWELGNELRYVAGTDSNPNTIASTRLVAMTAWMSELSAYIKSKDSNHLVGSGGITQFLDYTADDPVHGGTYYGLDFNAQHSLPNIDYFDFHIYPYNDSPTFTLRTYGQSGGYSGSTEAGFLYQLREFFSSARIANKPCVIGEYGIDKRNTDVATFPAYPRKTHFDLIINYFKAEFNGLLLWHYTNLFDDNNYNVKPDGVHTGGNANSNSNDDDTSLRKVIEDNNCLFQGNRVAAVSRAIRSAPIYGVKWLKVAGPTLERIDDAIGMVANAGVGSTPVTNDFDLADIYKDITEVTDVLGNVFIRIPKFYIKKCDGGGYKTWEISKQSFAGSYLPWCFWDFTNSVELDYVDVGKYTASLSGANKLQSIANTYPLINKNIVDFRTYAQANGAAYQQLDIHVVDILQILFIVEFATLNSQSIMNGFTAGQYNAAHTATVAENAVNRIIVANATAALYRVGQPISIGTSLGGNQIFYGRNITAIDVYDASNKAISFDGAAVNIAIGNILYNTGWKNGFSSGIAAKSGSLSSNSNGVNPFVYRGIENIFGNVWQFVDGVNINEYQAWICRNAASYASNVFASPYLQLSYINTNADGYPIEMGFDANNPFAHLSKTNGGSASTFYSDYYYRNTGQRIARFGGGWSNGSNAGLFCWDLGSASSAAYVAVSGRLLRKAL